LVFCPATLALGLQVPGPDELRIMAPGFIIIAQRNLT
jgi:hypothetical protein